MKIYTEPTYRKLGQNFVSILNDNNIRADKVVNSVGEKTDISKQFTKVGNSAQDNYLSEKHIIDILV